mmetsp:Transcript_56564/g.159517  ORF Transcript_56564/g.159517 Transcript_56564/m.159517 type:complete len:244 (-) Transcript_56564:1146-1877(-)
MPAKVYTCTGKMLRRVVTVLLTALAVSIRNPCGRMACQNKAGINALLEESLLYPRPLLTSLARGTQKNVVTAGAAAAPAAAAAAAAPPGREGRRGASAARTRPGPLSAQVPDKLGGGPARAGPASSRQPGRYSRLRPGPPVPSGRPGEAGCPPAALAPSPLLLTLYVSFLIFHSGGPSSSSTHSTFSTSSPSSSARFFRSLLFLSCHHRWPVFRLWTSPRRAQRSRSIFVGLYCSKLPSSAVA